MAYKIEIQMSYKNYRDILSYFKHLETVPLYFTKEGILLDFMTAGSLSYQHTLVKASIFKKYKLPKPFLAWIDIGKLAKRTVGFSQSLSLKVDDTKIYISSPKNRTYSQRLLNKPDPTIKIEFDDRGIPDLEPLGIDVEYDIAAEMTFPETSAIYSKTVLVHFNPVDKGDNEILIEMRDLDSDSKITIGKWESKVETPGITLDLFADLVKNNVKLFQSGKTIFVACSGDESAPLVAITKGKDIDNILMLMPINTDTAHIPDSLTEEDEIDEFSDDFDEDWEEEE